MFGWTKGQSNNGCGKCVLRMKAKTVHNPHWCDLGTQALHINQELASENSPCVFFIFYFFGIIHSVAFLNNRLHCFVALSPTDNLFCAEL